MIRIIFSNNSCCERLDENIGLSNICNTPLWKAGWEAFFTTLIQYFSFVASQFIQNTGCDKRFEPFWQHISKKHAKTCWTAHFIHPLWLFDINSDKKAGQISKNATFIQCFLLRWKMSIIVDRNRLFSSHHLWYSPWNAMYHSDAVFVLNNPSMPLLH